MKITFKFLSLSIFTILVVCASCSKDDEVTTPTDYRESFIGIYDCTKSSKSFDDDLFTTDIVVTIEIDSSTLTSLKINDQSIPVDDDGVFGPDYHNGQYYDLKITDDNLRLSINEVFPNGLALPCFIKGVKRE